jgi:hypothetical protein
VSAAAKCRPELGCGGEGFSDPARLFLFRRLPLVGHHHGQVQIDHRCIEGYRRANYSLRQIAQELTLRGLTPKRGGTWHPNQIRELLLLAQIPGRPELAPKVDKAKG